MKRVWIIAGGDIDREWARSQLDNIKNGDVTIAADKGEEFLKECGIIPDIWVGDMDSYSGSLAEDINTELHPVRKDETDLRLAILDAIDMHAKEVFIIGATGGRLDHFLGNVYLLAEMYEHNIKAYILDPQNKISLLGVGTYSFDREALFGTYISFLAFGGEAKIKYLSGFSYELPEYPFGTFDTIGISNKADKDTMSLEIAEGYLLMIESKDK